MQRLNVELQQTLAVEQEVVDKTSTTPEVRDKTTTPEVQNKTTTPEIRDKTIPSPGSGDKSSWQEFVDQPPEVPRLNTER